MAVLSLFLYIVRDAVLCAVFVVNHRRSMTGCLQLWRTLKTRGICKFWKVQGKLGEFKIYSGK